jgi:hypothetical protein
MNSEQFIYWLKGFMELQNPETMDKEQVTLVKDQLEMVNSDVNLVTPIPNPNMFPKWQEPNITPLTPNPNRIYCGDNPDDNNPFDELQFGVKKK